MYMINKGIELSIAFVALFTVVVPSAAVAEGKTPPPSATAGTSSMAFKSIDWTMLAPKDWDPMKALKDLNLGQIRSDADPRAIAAMAAMRKAWDDAPIEPTLNGSNIKIEGFVVPLDMTSEAIGEFLLVPFFGACIHTPPPPANQIIHIVPKEPQKGLRAMETVTIEGTMETVTSTTSMGNAGYRIINPKISIVTR
jgi:uncharacterized protein